MQDTRYKIQDSLLGGSPEVTGYRIQDKKIMHHASCMMCLALILLFTIHCSLFTDTAFAAKDPKAGACGSLYNIAQDDRMNHRLKVTSGVLETDSKLLLQEFFKTLRKEKR